MSHYVRDLVTRAREIEDERGYTPAEALKTALVELSAPKHGGTPLPTTVELAGKILGVTVKGYDIRDDLAAICDTSENLRRLVGRS